MTPSITANHGRNAHTARTAPKSAWKVAILVVGCGIGIPVAYLSALMLTGDVFGWEGDLKSFFIWATPALPILSLAVGSGLLAVRTPRPATRAVAGIACLFLAFLAFLVVRVAWTFTMTDWLVW